MQEFNHWKQQQKQIKIKDAEDRLIFWIIVFAGVMLLWII